jgi:hypothetical protein
VIATGRSQTTGKVFNIAVAFEPSRTSGPAMVESTFHHFADYNWNPSEGAPSFVSEPPGDGFTKRPESLDATHRYALNIARWLAGQSRT